VAVEPVPELVEPEAFVPLVPEDVLPLRPEFVPEVPLVPLLSDEFVPEVPLELFMSVLVVPDVVPEVVPELVPDVPVELVPDVLFRSLAPLPLRLEPVPVPLVLVELEPEVSELPDVPEVLPLFVPVLVPEVPVEVPLVPALVPALPVPELWAEAPMAHTRAAAAAAKVRVVDSLVMRISCCRVKTTLRWFACICAPRDPQARQKRWADVSSASDVPIARLTHG
jgi:hypothetical protein